MKVFFPAALVLCLVGVAAHAESAWHALAKRRLPRSEPDDAGEGRTGQTAVQ